MFTKGGLKEYPRHVCPGCGYAAAKEQNPRYRLVVHAGLYRKGRCDVCMRGGNVTDQLQYLGYPPFEGHKPPYRTPSPEVSAELRAAEIPDAFDRLAQGIAKNISAG